MRITRLVKVQLAVFMVVSLAAGSVMAFVYLKVPAMVFGHGHYDVRLELPESAGLYARANVTYRGAEVGTVTRVGLSDAGVEADLSLRSDMVIPSNLQAEVHSTSPIGEQYVDLVPRDSTSAPLKAGDVIPIGSASVPVDVNVLLDTTNRGLEAVPTDNLRTVIEESYTAFGGLGPEMSRIVTAMTDLSAEAHAELGAVTNLIDRSPAVLDSQTSTAGDIRNWARNLASISSQLRDRDQEVSSLLPAAGRTAAEGGQLLDRLKGTIPVLLSNLVSVAEVGVAYNANLEQLLVLYPAVIGNVQATGVASETADKYRGAFLQLNLNLNLPPVCTTGFLPAQQIRPPSLLDSPDRIEGEVYCRVPQDSRWNVRGARNIPCATKPGKRAPTVRMCESDEEYVPLNDGFNWKGDPNATLTGQGVPQMPGETASAAPVAAPGIAAAEYDPATGNYVGHDGRVYTQTDLVQEESPTLQSLLLPGQ